MRIDRDAAPFVALAAIPSAVAFAGGARRSATGMLVLPAAIAAFFRDPDRAPDAPGRGTDPHDVLAPADGRVMHAGVPQPDVAPPGEWQQISIFLSLTDVHINRCPWGGTVRSVDHVPGRYLAAFKAESAHQNERSELVIDAELDGADRTIVFRQIVGMAARRVVTRVGAGQRLQPGERIGLMKFGSRMDVFVPPDVELLVAEGDRTIAGESVIARFPRPIDLREAADEVDVEALEGR